MATDLGQVISLARSASRAADEALHSLGMVVKCLEDAGIDASDEARDVRRRLVELENVIRRQLLAFEDSQSIVRWV
jgi:hypothetical protein